MNYIIRKQFRKAHYEKYLKNSRAMFSDRIHIRGDASNQLTTNEFHLTIDEIMSTNDWFLGEFINSVQGYYWKHTTIHNDGFVIYVRIDMRDGYTTIDRESQDQTNRLFEGYLKNINEFNQIVYLCGLKIVNH